jgi:hypothetical protein
MAKPDPVKDPAFQRTLRNLLTAPPKTQAEMKVGKRTKAKPAKPTSKSRPGRRAEVAD